MTFMLQGATFFMHPLTLIFLINLGLIIFVIITRLQKKKLNKNILEAIRQLGGLALAWGLFSTLVGLFFAFDALAGMKETLPLYVIMGGLKVALITILYGLIIFMILADLVYWIESNERIIHPIRVSSNPLKDVNKEAIVHWFIGCLFIENNVTGRIALLELFNGLTGNPCIVTLHGLEWHAEDGIHTFDTRV